LPPAILTPAAIAQKESALANSALIGRVTNAAENKTAIEAMKSLKSLSSQFERERKELTEPLLEAQRYLKRAVDTERDELDREFGRLECLAKDFAMEEQRRIREEQEAQLRELARIEAEKQAELKRIADEQARVDREAREAREAAERAAREATNAEERKMAEAARIAAEEQSRKAHATAAQAAMLTQTVTDNADLRSRIESKPVEPQRAYGQSNRKVWKITQINDFQLMKARPDLIRKIEWDVLAIKQILNEGGKLPGVTAEEDLKVSVRGTATKTIEV
jgi:hypothetical protein